MSDKAVEQADDPIRPEHYVFVDNLRLVQPYLFDFKCYVKRRWEGRRLVDVFAEEFPLLTMEYYERAFKAGRLRVESSSGTPLTGPPMTLESKVSTGMCVRHMVHRHEPPVLAGDVQVLHVTSDWVVVVKPACMPVHTVGQYRKNTVLGVLSAHHPDLGHLYPTYRLDRPVSGLLVLARSSAAAGRMRSTLEDRSCEKLYVARVQGVFPASWEHLQQTSPARATDPHVSQLPADPWPEDAPSQPAGSPAAALPAQQQGSDHVIIQVDVPLAYSAQTNHATAVPSVTTPPAEPGATEPTNQPSQTTQARPATTQFRLLHVAADGQTSVVLCRPLTGRTHQIRVHLQYLGYPIANDTQYGGTLGKPLAFRRLRQAKQETQQARHIQQPDPSAQQPPSQFHTQQPTAAPQTEPNITQPACSAAHAPAAAQHPLSATDRPTDEQPPKRPRTDGSSGVSHGDVGARGHQAGMATHSTIPDSKRQELIAAFVNPEVLKASVITVPASQADGTAGTAHSDGQEQGEAADLATGGQSAADKRAALLCAAVAQAQHGPLPPELHTLYHDPRYRVPPELDEEVCPHCPCLVPQGYPIDLEALWLHAIRYKCDEWDYSAPMPDWASC